MDTDALSPAPAASPIGRRWPKVVMAAVLVAGIAIGSATTAVWAAHQFPDVPRSNPFHDDIDWLVDHDIASGFQDGTFKPGQAVTRQSMAAFLHRYNSEIEVVRHDQAFDGRYSIGLDVACPDGKRPVGGGGGTSAGALFMTDSYPTSMGWYARWETATNPTSGNAWAYVACIPS